MGATVGAGKSKKTTIKIVINFKNSNTIQPDMLNTKFLILSILTFPYFTSPTRWGSFFVEK